MTTIGWIVLTISGGLLLVVGIIAWANRMADKE